MHIEYQRSFSTYLGHDMELKVYGDSGKSVIVFPTLAGRFYDYEDFGMINAIESFITNKQIQVFTVDSIDHQSWSNYDISPAERALRHECYDKYITKELIPYIQTRNGTKEKMLITGCSMGGYHAANFFFRHPDYFNALIALSGLFRLNTFIGDYMDETVYLNTPIAYLPNLDDPQYLDQYRESIIIIATGQGAWEDLMVEDARTIQQILSSKNIPNWIDYWGYDVNHDWPWWQKMMPYFLDKIFNQTKLPMRNNE